MNKKQTTAVTLAVTGIAAARFSYVSLLHDLEERFPNIPARVIRKAYRQMWTDALRGRMPEVSSFSDEQVDEYFLLAVQRVLDKQK